jgi:hypothetical protein
MKIIFLWNYLIEKLKNKRKLFLIKKDHKNYFDTKYTIKTILKQEIINILTLNFYLIVNL